MLVVVASAASSEDDTVKPLLTAPSPDCALLVVVCGRGMTRGVISPSDLNESVELDDSPRWSAFRCCCGSGFFFCLLSLSTLAVKVRANDDTLLDDGDEELVDASESVSMVVLLLMPCVVSCG